METYKVYARCNVCGSIFEEVIPKGRSVGEYLCVKYCCSYCGCNQGCKCMGPVTEDKDKNAHTQSQ